VRRSPPILCTPGIGPALQRSLAVMTFYALVFLAGAVVFCLDGTDAW
jgi:hypothetical protein